jgi:hypothetical protein
MLLSLVMWSMGTGCDLVGQECNLMYAPDMLSLELIHVPLSETGATIFALVGSDGEGLTCRLEAPEDTSGTCSEGNDLFLERSGDTVTLSLWEFTPSSVELSLLHEIEDGVVKGSWTITPDYTEDEPNGEGCGFRSSATESVDLSTR